MKRVNLAKERQHQVQELSDLQGGHLKMILKTPSNSNSDFDSEYKKFDNREDIPF